MRRFRESGSLRRSHARAARRSSLTRSIAALGVVYGDIGTSVLYAFKECLEHGLHTDREIIGVLSLIIWSLFTLVSVKYLAIVMRADNQGEGGILALLSLAFPQDAKTRGLAAGGMIAVGIAGASLLYGDGVITPAISVLSAVEGLKLATAGIKPFIVPLTLGILAGLFAVQSKGTGAIGKWFGGVMLLWFSLLAVLGVMHIADHPSVLWALSPYEGLHYLTHHGKAALIVMGSVFFPRRHGRRGALRGHGPFRTAAHLAGVDFPRLPGADPKLPRAGRARPRQPRGTG